MLSFCFPVKPQNVKTNVRAHKINSITLEIYGIVVSTFFVPNKDGKERFFEKSFLLANVKSDIVFEIHFLTINNTDVDFEAWELQ